MHACPFVPKPYPLHVLQDCPSVQPQAECGLHCGYHACLPDGIVLFGIDSNLVSIEGVSELCQNRLWLVVIAFTMVYGSILAQTFSIFNILRNIKVAQWKDRFKDVGTHYTLRYTLKCTQWM